MKKYLNRPWVRPYMSMLLAAFISSISSRGTTKLATISSQSQNLILSSDPLTSELTRSQARAILDDTLLLISTVDGRLHALQLATGRLVWSFR